MGYDKPDLGFVVHVGSPPSPVSYYQQVGRAGRGIDHALVALLPSDADAGVWDYFATATIPDPDQVERLLAGLEGFGPDQPASVPALEAETGLRRTRVELMLKQLAVDGAVDRVEGGWLPHRRAVDVRRRALRRHRRGPTPRGRHHARLHPRRALPHAAAAGVARRPDRRAVRPLLGLHAARCPPPLEAAPSLDVARAVSTALRRETYVLEPRKMWPGGAFGSRGRIPPDQMADTGRALVFADAPEWRDVVRAAFDHDAPADRRARPRRASTCSGGWSATWAERPEVVVGAAGRGLRHADRVRRRPPGHRRPARRAPTSTLTDAPSASADLSSADEAAAWRDAISLSPTTTQQIADRVRAARGRRDVDAVADHGGRGGAPDGRRDAGCCRCCSIADRDRGRRLPTSKQVSPAPCA